MISGAHHHCHVILSHSATKQLRFLERRTVSGYLSFSYDCYTSPNVKEWKAIECRVVITASPVTERDQATAPSQTTSDTTTARTLPQFIFRIKCQSRRTLCSRMSRHHCHSARRGALPSNCALSHDEWHAATLTSPMTLLIQHYNLSFHHLPYPCHDSVYV